MTHAAAFAAAAPLRSPLAGARRARTRMVLAEKVDSAEERLYVGTAPVVRRGRLRVDFSERFAEPQEARVAAAVGRYNRWETEGAAERSLAIWGFIAAMLAKNWALGKRWTYLQGMDEGKRVARRRALAAWARERILELGPTMIKVGQLASSRSDILPTEVIEELSLLQDKVPAFSWRVAEKLLQEQYGRPVEEVFAYFDKRPLAAASLGQVHRATLFSGEEVVVKIQRPNLKRLFDLDLDALRVVAQYLQRSKKYGGSDRDWVGIYDECRKVLYEEVDYIREANSAERFGNNFRKDGIPYVKVPLVFRDYTTETVLCLQYLPGIRVSDKATLKRSGLDLQLITERLGSAFLTQILRHVFFSADPHPGNIAIGADNSIIFYDFGMMGELNPGIKERLVDILIGVIDKDADVVMQALVDLDALVLPADPSPVRRAIQFFLDNVGSRPNRDQTITAIGDDLYDTARDRPFRLPAQSIFLLRSLSTLEGLCKGLNPDFQFSQIALPFADEILSERTGGVNSPRDVIRSLANSMLTGKPAPIVSSVGKQAVGAGSNALRAVQRIEKIEKTLTLLERGDLKLRSRSTETEKLLRKQYSLTEASNFLLSTGATALAATQLYATGNIEPAALLAGLSATLGLVFIGKQTKLNQKDRYKLDE